MHRCSLRHIGVLIAVAAAGLAGLLPSAFSQPASRAHPANAPEAEDRILVRVKPGKDLDALHRQLGTRGRKLRRPADRGRGANESAAPALESIEVPAGRRAHVLATLRNSGLVEYAEPDYILEALTEPNDFRFWDGSTWHLRNTGIYGGTVGSDIDAVPAWDVRTSATGVVVAVIDTGVRTTHEDLQQNLWVNPGEDGVDAMGVSKRTNGVDDDGNGWVDDVHGINVLNRTGNPNDDYGHGTHVAGIIGAVGNNNVGVVGVAWQARIMGLKFLNYSGHGTISGAIECMYYARDHGAKIINASFGSTGFNSQALRDCIEDLQDAGILFVAACGNSNADNDVSPVLPASYPYDNIIAVAATTRTDARAGFSNWGRATVDLAAPGSPVFSLWKGSDSDYRYLDGTSMAAPVVAGAAALIWSHSPGLRWDQVKNLILSTTDPVPAFANKSVTGGRLNLFNALSATPSEPPPPEWTDVVWVEDAVPIGAWTTTSGGDTWNWVTTGPAPFSGLKSHRSTLAAGYHDHTFQNASVGMNVQVGDTLFVYVYVDPANPPQEIMVSWKDANWEHRAYWGANLINYGTNGTAGRRYMGPIPTAGEWVRLEVPASLVGLEGSLVRSMSFSLYGGTVTWDAAGYRTLISP